MNIYNYKFTHDTGAGEGSIEANNVAEAEQLVKASLVKPGTAVDAEKQPQPKNLKVTVQKQ